MLFINVVTFWWGEVSQKVTNSSKKESDQHSIREKGESCINDVILEKIGDQMNIEPYFCLSALGIRGCP